MNAMQFNKPNLLTMPGIHSTVANNYITKMQLYYRDVLLHVKFLNSGLDIILRIVSKHAKD